MGAELSTPSAAEQLQTTEKVTSETTHVTPETRAIALEETVPIFERYVEPPGTKVEVDPTEVLESADVVKKGVANKKIKEESKAK
jgi:hypothetical protein